MHIIVLVSALNTASLDLNTLFKHNHTVPRFEPAPFRPEL